MRRLRVGTLVLIALAAPAGAEQPVEEKYKQGHSRHGDAFDVGPRERPWAIEGIGSSHFPVTTSNPEVQKWFDQGHTLLHSFWYYEAERAFRWAVKLDPECAMGYWGLARASGDADRAASFMKEAVRRKDKVSARERDYIEAWNVAFGPDEPRDPAESAERNRKRDRYKRLLEKIVLRYPDDLEAKALFGLESLGGDGRYGTDLLLQQVIARDPNHPGAHHYRIHNWDSADGGQALESCRAYARVAPGIGHAQHMPGHIYSGVGMWHEAAIAMDAATRVEASYMRRRMIFPFNDWNYGHNRNYLSFIQEQLGMAEAALAGTRELLSTPRDPKYDRPDGNGSQWQGMVARMRALIKFERWKEILEPNAFPWGETVRDKMHRAYCETLGHAGLGERDRALKKYEDHARLQSDVKKPDNNWLERTYGIQSLELRAALALAKGDTLTGIGLLSDAARREIEARERQNDPPDYPRVLYNVLGRVYLASGSPKLAAAAFERTLELVRSDGFALSGLVEAYAAAGEREKARDAWARLQHVWSDADPGLTWLEHARAVGLEAKPRDASPAAQRSYRKTSLEQFGPNVWEPYPAPQLDALDSTGKKVTPDEYRGKNVLVIFYLGEECPHCMEQLAEVSRRRDELAKLETEVLAISSAKPEQNSQSAKVAKLPFRLLSDVSFENARRFKSYDDFEEIELHSTILVDARGRVHWARHGGAPFTDFDFLVKEIKRLNERNAPPKSPAPARTGPR